MYWKKGGDNIVAQHSNNIIIETEEGYAICISYSTLVAWYRRSDGTFHRSWGGYSRTTQRHLSRFCDYLGISNPCKKDWEAMDVEPLPFR